MEIKASLVGLSLSYCIKDIIDGKVKEEEVIKIITRTMAFDEGDWKNIIEHYQHKLWESNPKKAEEIFRRFLEAGKIEQPRTTGKETHSLIDGHWLIKKFYQPDNIS